MDDFERYWWDGKLLVGRVLRSFCGYEFCVEREVVYVNGILSCV